MFNLINLLLALQFNYSPIYFINSCIRQTRLGVLVSYARLLVVRRYSNVFSLACFVTRRHVVLCRDSAICARSLHSSSKHVSLYLNAAFPRLPLSAARPRLQLFHGSSNVRLWSCDCILF